MTSAFEILSRVPRPKLYFGYPLRLFFNERQIWHGMRRRCHDPKDVGYRWYGAKGVIVCERWRTSFENFLLDMGPRPSIKHSIDRIDPCGNYEPGNCRWTTADVQARNKQPRILPHNSLLIELENIMRQLPQRTQCSVPGGCSDLGGPCPSCICLHCDGKGYVPGDPEGAPIEDCQRCNSTGRYVHPSC